MSNKSPLCIEVKELTDNGLVLDVTCRASHQRRRRSTGDGIQEEINGNILIGYERQLFVNQVPSRHFRAHLIHHLLGISEAICLGNYLTPKTRQYIEIGHKKQLLLNQVPFRHFRVHLISHLFDIISVCTIFINTLSGKKPATTKNE